MFVFDHDWLQPPKAQNLEINLGPFLGMENSKSLANSPFCMLNLNFFIKGIFINLGLFLLNLQLMLIPLGY